MPEAVDLATNGKPPEGERGTANPSGYVAQWGNVFGAYDDWTGSLGREPSERDLSNMLDRDGKAQSLEQVLTLPLRWADVTIEPAEGDTGEAELVTQALLTPPHEGGMSTPLDHVIAQMTAAVWQRRSYHEKVFRVDGDRVTYKKLMWLPADSCRIKRNKRGGFEGIQQRAPYDDPNADEEGWITIEPDKALVYIHDQGRAPLNGRSALQTAYRAFEAKQKVRFLLFAFIERFAMPWGIAKDEQDPGNVDALARKIAGLRDGGVAGIGGAQSVDFLEASSDGGVFFKALDWLSAEMSQSVLASFTDLAQQGSGKGSFALSRDQSDFYLRSCEARQSELAATLTVYCASDLVKWNRGAAGRTPTLKFAKLSDERAEDARLLLEKLLSQPVPDPRIPDIFFDLLLEKVAAILGPQAADQIHRAIEARKAQSPGERVAGVVGEAAALVAEAGVAPVA